MISIRPISNYLINIQNRQNVAATQQRMARAGQELATGLLADVYSSRGMSSSTSITLRNMLSQTEEFTVQNNMLSNKTDIMADSLATAREASQEAMRIAVQNVTHKTPTSEAIIIEAKAAAQLVIQSLNVNLGGENLFSGINSEKVALTKLGEEVEGTGMNPLELIESIIGGIPGNVAEANDAIDAIDAFFDSANPPPGPNFEGTLYNGTPLLDEDGNPNSRIIARIDQNEKLDLGIQANDEGIRTTLKGLYMLSAIDVSEFEDPDAYVAYMEHAVAELDRGIGLIQDAEAKLGTEQELLSKVQDRQADQVVILNNRLVGIEHVDPYDAQVRLTMLETQLQATYNVSARMGQMSFVNWMR